MALRVIVACKHECYTALRAVQSVYRVMPERSKDFIKDIKKPNGYQSLHETLHGEGGAPVEVGSCAWQGMDKGERAKTGRPGDGLLIGLQGPA